MIRLKIAIVLALAISRVSTVVIYIIPKTPKIPCPGFATNLCMELSDYYLYKKENNTNLVFLPGEHALTSKITFSNLINFTLTGVSSTVASSVIRCYNENGSIIFNSISNLVVKNISFRGCQGQKHSLVILANTQSIFIVNSDFLDIRHLGALFIENCKNLTVFYTKFTRNQNVNKGGALYVAQSDIQISNCLFTDNKASNYGGAIFIVDSKMYIQDSHFINNTAMNGGALSIINENLSISKSSFRDNVALKYGGSLYSEHFSGNHDLGNTLEIIGSHFINCRAISGAALTLFRGKSFILNSSFSNNSVTEGGGGIYTFEAVLNIVSSTFSNNTGNLNKSITYGGAMYVDQQSTVTIKQSQFVLNQVHGYGGAIFSSTETNITAIETYFEKNYNSIDIDYEFGGGALSLSGNIYTFENCSFIENTAIKGGAIFNYFAKMIYIKLCTFYGNSAWKQGGALHTCELCHTQLDSSRFSSNTAQIGSVIYAQGSRINSIGPLDVTYNSGLNLSTIYFHQCIVNFYGSFNFANNRGSLFSFASVIKFYEKAIFSYNKEPESLTPEEGGALTFIQSDAFIGGYFNMCYNKARFGGAMYLSNTNMLVALSAQVKVYNNTAFISGAAVYCVQTKLNLFAQIKLSWNEANLNGGGIMAKGSTIIVNANQLKLAHNQAKYGGGIYLQGTSMLFVHKNKPLASAHNFYEFSGNTADLGGAVFVKDDINSGLCTSNSMTGDQSHCFFQVLRIYSSFDKQSELPFSLFSAAFINNTAKLGGNSVYGGLLDRCSYSMFSEFLSVYPPAYHANPISILKTIAILDDENPTISSDPVRICFCMNSTLNCNLNNITISAKKGHSFNISLVAVDQALNPLPAIILSSISSIAGLNEGQANQSTPATCSELEYNVYSPSDEEHMILFAQGPCESKGVSQSKVIIHFEPCNCAIGFQHSNSSSACECVCDSRLSPFITNCSSNQTLNKRSDLWFSFTNETVPTGFLIYKHCPYDYCVKSPVAIDLNLPHGADAQCAFHRSGKLCGSCANGYSLILGSSRCLQCTNSHLAILIIFAIAGVILVFLLLALNMTVAVGTINGLVFYANIVVTNRSLFLPDEMPAMLSVFIAWINLDLGIETCFYNGMDMYSKTLLQVVFPSYILILVVLIIVACKWSKRFSTLVSKRNPVATLATLILLSFTKFLRILTIALSFGYLQLPDGSSSIVWLPDGNVLFLATTHVIRFIVVAIIIIAGIGYITLLLFEHRCRKYTNRWRAIKCFNNTKLHGFMDTYYAPFNPRYRYWVGLLLLVRILLFVLIAVVLNSNPALKKDATLLVVIATVFALILIKQLQTRVYKNWIVDFLETSFLVNLGIFADGTYHNMTTETEKRSSAQFVLASVSVSVALATFLVTFCYHLCTFVLPVSWMNCLKQSIVTFFTFCRQERNSNIPYQAINEGRGGRDGAPEPALCIRDSTLREPNLDELAPLTSNDWLMANRQQHPLPQEPHPNNVTHIIVERRRSPPAAGSQSEIV